MDHLCLRVSGGSGAAFDRLKLGELLQWVKPSRELKISGNVRDQYRGFKYCFPAFLYTGSAVNINGYGFSGVSCVY